MLIAFEGPDNVGKSTSAANLDHSGFARYNMTVANYADAKAEGGPEEPDLVRAFDRIDWMTHMLYRLGMPAHEWNDSRVRTVFAAPDTHLVFKLHRQDMADKISDELYETGSALAEVNRLYSWYAEWLMGVNALGGYKLFRTISIMEVVHDQTDKTFSQRLLMFDSPAFEWGTVAERLVHDDASLLELLHYEEQHRDR